MDKFYGCYLLESLSQKHRTYIGFTVDPRRRIRQHNGEIPNGAWKTRRWRPWKMVLIVWGLPNKIAALQFEHAWQHPAVSRHVKGSVQHLGFCKTTRKGRQREVLGTKKNIQVLFEMLQTSPYCRMPLLVQVFDSSTFWEVLPQLKDMQQHLPSHIAVSHGSFDDLEHICAEQMTARRRTVASALCEACCETLRLQDRIVSCPSCASPFHVSCAAQAFNGLGGQLAMPDNVGKCPKCKVASAWPVLVKSARRLSQPPVAATESAAIEGALPECAFALPDCDNSEGCDSDGRESEGSDDSKESDDVKNTEGAKNEDDGDISQVMHPTTARQQGLAIELACPMICLDSDAEDEAALEVARGHTLTNERIEQALGRCKATDRTCRKSRELPLHTKVTGMVLSTSTAADAAHVEMSLRPVTRTAESIRTAQSAGLDHPDSLRTRLLRRRCGDASVLNIGIA